MNEKSPEYMKLESEWARNHLKIKELEANENTKEKDLLMEALQGYRQNIEWQLSKYVEGRFMLEIPLSSATI